MTGRNTLNETALLRGFYVGSFVDVDDDFGVVVCGDSGFFVDGADGPYPEAFDDEGARDPTVESTAAAAAMTRSTSARS